MVDNNLKIIVSEKPILTIFFIKKNSYPSSKIRFWNVRPFCLTTMDDSFRSLRIFPQLCITSEKSFSETGSTQFPCEKRNKRDIFRQ